MKKLEKLRLHDAVKIPEAEQRELYGGGSWVTGPDGNQYYCPGEVNVMTYTGSWDSYCPRCQQNEALGYVSDPMYGSENIRFGATIKEFFGNTIPHLLGIAGHIDGSETYGTYIVYGSNN